MATGFPVSYLGNPPSNVVHKKIKSKVGRSKTDEKKTKETFPRFFWPSIWRFLFQKLPGFHIWILPFEQRKKS